MTSNHSEYFEQHMVWNKTNDAEFPFQVSFEQRNLSIRINDFPAEALYTLLIDDQPICDFDDWPENWQPTIKK